MMGPDHDNRARLGYPIRPRRRGHTRARRWTSGHGGLPVPVSHESLPGHDTVRVPGRDCAAVSRIPAYRPGYQCQPETVPIVTQARPAAQAAEPASHVTVAPGPGQ